jgi:hypothetical protein
MACYLFFLAALQKIIQLLTQRKLVYGIIRIKQFMRRMILHQLTKHFAKNFVLAGYQWLFLLLGVGNKEKGIASSLHTPTFNIDEDALTLSTGLMAWIALRRLGVDE